MNDYNINDEYVRPKNLAKDDSSLIDVCIDVLEFYKNEDFNNMCLIWATAPMIDSSDLINSFEQFSENEVDGVVACTEYTHTRDLVIQGDDKLINPLISYNDYKKYYLIVEHLVGLKLSLFLMIEIGLQIKQCHTFFHTIKALI